MRTAARSVARHIVSALKPLPLDAVFCDNACGTGAVTAEILRVFPHATVHATDHSQGMLNLLQQSLQKNGKASQVELGLLNSIQVTLEDNLCDLHIMNFGIFFTTDPRQTAIEINRTLKKGGRAAVTCWKTATLFNMFFDIQAAVSRQPGERAADSGQVVQP